MNALSKKILVVDDDPVVGHSFDRVLSKKGYAVIAAANGEEALAKLAAENYDVVYTDIRMPGMDGIEVAGRIKAKRPWLPVVIVTGYGSAENEAKANAVGVSAFLHKPLLPEAIEDSARKALAEGEAAAMGAEAVPGALEVPAPAAPAVVGWRAAARFAKNMALFFAAPFVGLAYIVALPFVGLFLIGGIAAKAFAARFPIAGLVLKNIVMFLAAGFIGLAYVIAGPFVGIALLLGLGGRALLMRRNTE